MDLAEKIDPAEVLSHLNQMGYHNITPQQLKEFVKDLKKLITYDRLSSSSGSMASLSSTITSCSEYYSSTESPSNSHKDHSSVNAKTTPDVAQKCSLQGREHNVNKSNQYCSNILSASSCSGSVMRRSSTSLSSVSKKGLQKENLPRGRTKSISEDNLHEAVKPKTSFIRPWQLQGVPSNSMRSSASDPVSLYHYYQTLWAKRKCPGEDSHADLRWVIREKMLGQDPHLYSKNVAGMRNSSRLRM